MVIFLYSGIHFPDNLKLIKNKFIVWRIFQFICEILPGPMFIMLALSP